MASRSIAGVRPTELVALAALLVVAAAVRFVDLPARGPWDADQGHDMLVLRAFVRDGVVPLLGPPTSIGDFHHGVLYYDLLAPVAALSGADPVAVVAAIAAAGVAAVAVTWWLARSIGGPGAGIAAGLVMAMSAAAIEESTFIWNPNIIALSSAIALAAAWRALSTGRAGWWIVAAAGQAVTMHGHVLGAVLLIPLAGLLVADVRRRRGAERRGVVRSGLIGLVLIAATYLPLLAYELGHDFAESRAALEFLSAGGDPNAASPPVRLVVVAVRLLSWPLTGLVTSAPAAAMLAAVGVVAVMVWRARSGRGGERLAVLWLAGTFAWSAVALALVAPSLATVVPGLPNDHYHAFLDPIVFVTVGLGAAALWELGILGRLTTIVTVVALIAFNIRIWPPPVAPDGGWPGADAAARRIAGAVGDGPFVLLGQPVFKSTDGYGFPLVRLGREPQPSPPVASGLAPGTSIVVVCDRLFESVVGAACGGQAEDALAGTLGAALHLEDRFDASPRTSVSIYRSP